ncbi:MAG: metallophosphoesterase [Methanomicrobiaceae archaeon]|nr:metallophosphoesterase [Methanomicrobiaceae archaeon]
MEVQESKEEKKCFNIKPLPDDRSIIVVSDLHLGGNEDDGNKIGRGSTAERFCRFLDHLKNNPNPEVKGCNKNKRLLPPGKIILLGDILELWDTRQQDRNNAFFDAILPFRKLQGMDCDVVYVTGNHDEDVVEYITSLDKENKDRGDNFKKYLKEHPELESHYFQEKDNLEKNYKKNLCLLYPTNPESAKPVTAKPDEENNQIKDYEDNIYLPYPTKPDKENNQKKDPISIQLFWNDNHFLEICSRHYPSHKFKTSKEDGAEGIKAGKKSYAFIHGHQFDKGQITYPIKQALGRCYDPIDYFQDLANTSFSKMFGTTILIFISLFFISLMTIFFFKIQLLQNWIGLITGIIFLAFFPCFLYRLCSTTDDIKAKIWTIFINSVFVIIFILIIAIIGWLFKTNNLNAIFLALLFVTGYLFFVICIPRAFAFIKRSCYNFYSTIKGRQTENIRDNIFNIGIFEYKSEVLVFGHTHVADYEKYIPDKKDKFFDKLLKLLSNYGEKKNSENNKKNLNLLVNTGSWIMKENAEYDTFAYIDKDGICCMRWVDYSDTNNEEIKKDNEEYGHIECFRPKHEEESLCQLKI